MRQTWRRSLKYLAWIMIECSRHSTSHVLTVISGLSSILILQTFSNNSWETSIIFVSLFLFKLLEKLKNNNQNPLHLRQGIWTNLVPYQRLVTLEQYQTKPTNQLNGLKSRPLSTNINPLKDWPDPKERWCSWEDCRGSTWPWRHYRWWWSREK